MLQIELVPILGDNYAYLLHDPGTGTSAVVDPGAAAPVLEALRERGRGLDLILITHHHGDHTGGNVEVKQATGARIVGPEAERRRIPGLDVGVAEGGEVEVGGSVFRVIETPGHTSGHVSLWSAADEALFSGDTLFALGCGRVIEGDMAQMWASLSKLMTLPDPTRVYCGHEYTQSNARFALTVDPENARLEERAAEVDRRRAAGEPTVPSTLGEERATNPFVRAGDAGLRRRLGLEGSPDAEVFAEVRRRKDSFR